MHGLKVGEIHRNRFDKRVRDLLEEMPLLNVAIEPLLRSRSKTAGRRCIRLAEKILPTTSQKGGQSTSGLNQYSSG